MLPLFNTQQYDEGRAFFVQGLEDFQNQLSFIESNQPWARTKVSALSTVLLSVSKAMTVFLSMASSLPNSSTNIRHGQIKALANAWVTNAIIDLRILCYRYSLTATRIAEAMERRRNGEVRSRAIKVKVERQISSGEGVETSERMSVTSEPFPSNEISPTTSTYSGTSEQSLWSRVEGTSPTGTMSSEDHVSEGERK